MRFIHSFKWMLFIVFGVLFFLGCSTHNNAWLNRNFHALGTYYNILYNGNIALAQGKRGVIKSFRDNFWEVLPVERVQFRELSTTSEKPTNSNFARAEEKATKAIQRHSILIDGVQYNPQMDEAFLLLGKARYYDQRFVPALAAFNYIIDHGKDSLTLVPVYIWRAKTQLRLEFPRLALKDLKKLRASKIELKDETSKRISAVMAQAYLDLEVQDSALVMISHAAALTKNKEEKGRYLFIKGQLLNKLGVTDSANKVYDQIIALKRKTPRSYRMHAFFEKAKHFNYQRDSTEMVLAMLNGLAEDRENEDYLANIYFQKGNYYRHIDSLEAAVEFYHKSVAENNPDTYLNSRAYLHLGNIAFNSANYADAGSFYEKTLRNTRIGTREYRLLQEKVENLGDVIHYEDIAVKNDSILRLVNMNEAERLAYFTTYTDTLRSRAMKQAVRAMNQAKKAQQNKGGFLRQSANRRGNQEQANEFYFYKQTRVAYGKLEFEKKWGDRKLQDNWRTISASAAITQLPKGEVKMSKEEIIAELDADSTFMPQTYIVTIPSDAKVIDSLKKSRDFAYYQLGVIYKEQFKEYHLAIAKFEDLLSFQPEKRLVLPSKYNLYKLYQLIEAPEQAKHWKNDIIQKHSNSRYASILLNPTSFNAGVNSPEVVYDKLYIHFKAQNYQRVIDSSEVYAARYTGEDIAPKFELLKAKATGRLLGFDAYEKALNYVALKYPLSEAGKKAKKRIAETIPALANEKFKADSLGDKHHLVFVFEQKERPQAIALDSVLNTLILEKGYSVYRTSIDVYSPEKIFVLIHGLSSEKEGEKLMKIAQSEPYVIENEFFDVTSANYKIIQVHKKLKAYLKQKKLINNPQI